MRKFLFILALLMFAGVSARTADAQRVFYIDYSAGSNSNAGTSTGAPWKTAPTMNHSGACDGEAGPSYMHQSGDKFAFKGGVTWPASCFQITLSAGGTSSAQDYYGVCLSSDPDSPCYGGTSWPATGWTRPFWGGSNAYIASGDRFIYANGVHDNTAAGFGYITIDNIEIGNWNVSPGGIGSGNTDSGPAIAIGGAQNYLQMPGSIVENMYIHDWVADTAATTLGGGNGWAYGTVYGAAIMRNSVISDQLGYYNVNNGTNHLINYPFMGGCAGCGNVSGLVVKYAWMGCSSCYSVHDSDFSFIEEDPSGLTYPNPPTGIGIHSHIIYDDGGLQQTYYVYNNAIHDSPNAGLNVYVAYESYVFNNVAWNLGNNGAFVLDKCIALGNPCNDSSSQVGYFANNTTDESGTGGLGCYRWNPGSASGLGTLNMYNNICIPNGSGPGSFSVATINGTATNYTMTPSEASAFGFTAPNKYAPTSSDSNIVGKGTALNSFCAGGLAPLCSDTRGASWFGGTYVARTTSWDDGAYQGPGGGGGNPPPTSAITAPTQNATVSGSSVTLTATCTPGGSATVSNIQFFFEQISFGSAGTSSPYSITLDSTKVSNEQHSIYAVCTQSDNQTATAPTITVTISNSIPGCFITDPSNINPSTAVPIPTQNGTFTATWTETPNSSTTNDSVIGLAATAVTSYSGLATALRASGSSPTSGQWDVFNGSIPGYSFTNTATYAAGTTDTFSGTFTWSSGNFTSYSISETSPSSIIVASGFAARNTAASLAYLVGISDGGVYDTVKVCNFAIAGSSPTISVSPGNLAFGSVVEGNSPTLNDVVTVATGPSTGSGASISGSSDFTVSANTFTGSVSSSGTVTVKYAPTTTGPETATLSLSGSFTPSPQTFTLTGTGVSAASPTVTLSTNASNPVTSINFNSWLIFSPSGPTATITGTVVNGPATISVSVTGGDASDFKITSDGCTASVSSQCQEVVQYTPHRFGTETTTLAFAISGQATQNVTLIATSVVSTQIVAVPF